VDSDGKGVTLGRVPRQYSDHPRFTHAGLPRQTKRKPARLRKTLVPIAIGYAIGLPS